MDNLTIIHDEAENGGSERVYHIRRGLGVWQSSVATRVDKQQRRWPSTGYWLQKLKDAFLPVGFPESVAEDYLPYQIFDSLQAFCSSIAGLLSSRAVLQGYGVGDATASATSTVLLTIIKDSISRLSTILFASYYSTSLSPHLKRYRFLADIFNDAAMVLDCLSPAIPTHYGLRLAVLCGSGVLRSLCGVAAGGTKAGLSSHFARGGNVAELNAKDSSQETLISLLGLLFGTLTIRLTPSPLPTFPTLLVLLGLHLYMNYLAVRAVALRTVNAQRLILITTVFSRHYTYDFLAMKYGEIATLPLAEGAMEDAARKKLSFRAIAQKENILFYNTHLQPTFGVSDDGPYLQPIFGGSGGPHLTILLAPQFSELTTRLPVPTKSLPYLIKVFRQEPFLVWFDTVDTAVVVLKKKVPSPSGGQMDCIKGWMLAEFFCSRYRWHRDWYPVSQSVHDSKKEISSMIRAWLAEFNEVIWPWRERVLRACGWDLEEMMLVIGEGGFRFRIEEGEGKEMA